LNADRKILWDMIMHRWRGKLRGCFLRVGIKILPVLENLEKA
jgi:hypothetical protein